MSVTREDYVYALKQQDADLAQKEGPRLWRQHRMLRDYFGSLIYVDGWKPVGDATVRILDSGTGSGIWLLDMEKELSARFGRDLDMSRVELIGIDPDSRLFPSIATSDPRYQFLTEAVQDVTTTHPEWENYFTLVNQRLLLAALTHADWQVAIANIFKILSPGGHAQFLEIGYTTVRDLKTGDVFRTHGGSMSSKYDSASNRLQTVIQGVFTARHMEYYCFDTIQGKLEAAGFINTSRKELVYSLSEEPADAKDLGEGKTTGGDCRECMADALAAIQGAALSLGLCESAEKYQQLVASIRSEWASPERDAKYHIFVITGQKPPKT